MLPSDNTTYIALDLGTTFLKGGILDLDHSRISHIRRRPFPERIDGLPPRHFEVNPAAVLHATRSLLTELLDAAPQCRGIVLCSQMHGVILTDAQGQPRSNLITWLDQRALDPLPDGSGAYLDRMREALTDQQVRELGNELRPGLPICALFWLAEQNQLPSQPTRVASLPDFVAAQLTQTPPQITEPTNAAACGGMDLQSLGWHAAALTNLGLDGLQWPEIRPFGAVSGRFSAAGREIPLYTPVGDHQCALVGAFLDEGELSLNISTGAQASLITPTARFGPYQTRPFFGRYLNTITHIPGGRALNALVALLTEMATAQGVTLPDPWAYLMAAVEATPETDLTANLLFFGSELTSQGAIANIRGDNLSVGHLLRAALVDMARHYESAALRLSPTRSWQRLAFSGGLGQGWPALRQTVGAPLSDNHRLAASSEDTLLGLMALALVAEGRAATVAAATRTLLALQSSGHVFV